MSRTASSLPNRMQPKLRHSPDRPTRRYLARLRALARRLEHQVALIRNGGFNPDAEDEASRLANDAFALRWALRELAPEHEATRQFFDSLHG